MQLDEIRATFLESVDRFARVVWRGDRDGTGEARLRPIEHGAARHDARTYEAAVFDLVAPALHGGEFAAHVSHASYAIGDEQRQRDLFGVGEPVAEGPDGRACPTGRESSSRPWRWR